MCGAKRGHCYPPLISLSQPILPLWASVCLLHSSIAIDQSYFYSSSQIPQSSNLIGLADFPLGFWVLRARLPRGRWSQSTTNIAFLMGGGLAWGWGCFRALRTIDLIGLGLMHSFECHSVGLRWKPGSLHACLSQFPATNQVKIMPLSCYVGTRVLYRH